MAGGAFHGIPPEALAFLKELAAHNDRAWFAEHKADYQDAIREPLRRLIEAFAPVMTAIDPDLDCNPLGSAVSRLHRDTRFSKDKSPYRLRQWIAFKKPVADWSSRPAFFMEFGAADWRFGMGYCNAAPAAMAKMRAAAGLKPEAFAAALERMDKAGLEISGDRYSRSKVSAELPEILRDWCDRKSPNGQHMAAVGPLFHSADMMEALIAAYQAAAPLYLLLKDAAAFTA